MENGKDGRMKFITPKIIAQELGISLANAYKTIISELPYIKIGRQYRVKRAAYEAWLKNKERINDYAKNNNR